MALHHRRNTIWQWNCRGFSRKRAVLETFLTNIDKPEVIALQECSKHAKLASYKSYAGRDDNTRVVTLVKRNITVLQHNTGTTNVDHILIEIIPQKRKFKSLFILNVYSPPRQKRQCNFNELFAKARVIAKGGPLLIVGDFNAHHTAWGYRYTQVKGRELWNSIQQNGLLLLTDPLKPTRQGNSVSIDTSPDLTLTGGCIYATWCNTGENLGSDHKIIEIVVDNGPPVVRTKKATLVNWEAFRNGRTGDEEGISNIDDWNKKVIQSVNEATEEVEVDEDIEGVDRHMVRLWRKKKDLETRLTQKRGNRNLRRELAVLNKEIEEYALVLTRQNWGSICEKLDRNIGNASTWHLLRHLLDPDKSKLEARQQIHRLIHTFDGTAATLIAQVRDRYLNCAEGIGQQMPDYKGQENPELDSPITVAEVRAEINRLRTKTAAGPDRVNNRMLRNLDDASIRHLAAFMQECWEAGRCRRHGRPQTSYSSRSRGSGRVSNTCVRSRSRHAWGN